MASWTLFPVEISWWVFRSGSQTIWGVQKKLLRKVNIYWLSREQSGWGGNTKGKSLGYTYGKLDSTIN